MTELSSYEVNILKKMYDRYKNEMPEKNNTYLIVSSIDNNKNTIGSYILKTKYITDNEDVSIRTLVDLGYIRCYKIGEYVLTAKGIWLIESNFYGLTIDDILEKLDCKKIGLGLEKITDRNKIVLFSLILARAFSSDSTINRSTEEKENAFLKLLETSFNFLNDMNCINISSFNQLISATTKTKISSVLSGIDSLPASTYYLFVAMRDNKYYLNLINDEDFDKNGLISLLKIIFEKIELKKIDAVVKFCNDMYLSYGYLFYNDTKKIGESDLNCIIEACIYSVAGL